MLGEHSEQSEINRNENKRIFPPESVLFTPFFLPYPFPAKQNTNLTEKKKEWYLSSLATLRDSVSALTEWHFVFGRRDGCFCWI